MKQNLVLIGNGMAGMRTVEELLKLEPEKYNITSLVKSLTVTTIALCYRLFWQMKRRLKK